MIKEILFKEIPLYSALIVDKNTEEKINSMLPKPKDFNDEFHTTVCYSKKPMPIKKDFLEERDLPYRGTAKVIDWVIFESENYGRSFCLVLDCPLCVRKFNVFVLGGASFDYDKYVPHLTLYYDLPKNIKPEELFERFKGLEIKYSAIRFEEINEEKYKEDTK